MNGSVGTRSGAPDCAGQRGADAKASRWSASRLIADPTPKAIEDLMQELQRNQEAALIVIEQSLARNPGRFLRRALSEGGHIVITEIPEIHLSGSYCSRVESLVQSILGPESLETQE